jgi:hypothetical protein
MQQGSMPASNISSPRAGGDLGYRVRAGHLAAKADGNPVVAQIKAAGFASSVIYTGWNCDAGVSTNTRGPWNLEVITIDPKTFTGRLAGSFGLDLEKPETTSQLATDASAIAAVNAGYFVFDPAAGAEGAPAGVGVYGGKTLSEPVADRPALVIDGNKNSTSIQRLTWAGSVASASGSAALDGIDRVPGLIRNCGAANGLPTRLALHDVTCTNANELVVFTPEFGPSTPAGPGLEAVVGSHDTVTAIADTRHGRSCRRTHRPGNRDQRRTAADNGHGGRQAENRHRSAQPGRKVLLHGQERHRRQRRPAPGQERQG